jgi:tetratricopeptide (TPR) repeat protein
MLRLRLLAAASALVFAASLGDAFAAPPQVLDTASSAAADTLAEVHRLHYAGQTDAALRQADTWLAGHPNDAQMRFLKGVMLADSKRRDEAVAVFQKLVDDYPDLAEPYNNLAALYAAGGDYGRARVTLEQAIRANPSYATAHENLGDVYAALASQSYERARRLDPANATLEPKLALVRQLFKPRDGGSTDGTSPAAAPSGASSGAAASVAASASSAR